MTYDLTEPLELLTSTGPDAARFDVLIDYTSCAVQFH